MSRGVTLFELLVVLAIVGLVMASVTFLSGRSGPEARAAATEIASALRQTRGNAISRFQPVTFQLDLENRTYRVGEDGAVTSLDPDLALELYTARSELVADQIGAIRFFPDGSATGGSVTLAREGHRYVVAVDWLTGAVSVEP